METHINSWGNSLAVRLPKSLLELYGLSKGATVDLSITDDGILLRPARKKDPIEKMLDMTADIDMDSMCAAITEENKPSPEDFEWGKPVGKEIW